MSRSSRNPITVSISLLNLKRKQFFVKKGMVSLVYTYIYESNNYITIHSIE